MKLAAGRVVTVVWVNGIARGNLRRLVAEARDQHAMHLNAWRVIHE